VYIHGRKLDTTVGVTVVEVPPNNVDATPTTAEDAVFKVEEATFRRLDGGVTDGGVLVDGPPMTGGPFLSRDLAHLLHTFTLPIFDIRIWVCPGTTVCDEEEEEDEDDPDC
jgi:hypothetical protein